MNRTALTGIAAALILGTSLVTTGCSTRSAVGGAAVGAAAVGGVYEYQNKRALDALEAQYRAGEISGSEYERRRNEIRGRSLIY